MKIVTFTCFDASIDPIHIDKPIICQTAKDNIMTFKDIKSYIQGDPEPHSNWKWICDKYNIKQWAYQENLII